MQSVLLVFLGGGLGSVVRYALGKWINTLHTQHFPWGTLTANVLACLALGWIIGLADHKQLLSPLSRLFWTVGFCGGFSTFSAFSFEALVLFQGGFQFSLVLYLLTSLVLCIAGAYAGLYLGQAL